MNPPHDQHRSDRTSVTLPAKCRTMGGMRDQGELSDISTHGCRVSTRSLYLSVGSRVSIKPEGLESISGVVRWIVGNHAGVEFDTPLYGPIVDHLVRQRLEGHGALIDCRRR